MTKFILHGGYTRDKNELNRSFFEEISKDIPDGGTILFVYFAGKDNEIGEKYEEDKENVVTGAHGKSLNVVLAKEEDFIEQVKQSSAIYIRGGDTAKLLSTLKKYPDFTEAIQGKTIAGSSAGAYVLSTFFFSNDRGRVFEGLGILPIRVLCHYQSTKHQTQGSGLESLEQYPQNLELIVLRDYEWRVFET
jgi:peptidase E